MTLPEAFDALAWIVFVVLLGLLIAGWREQRALRCPKPPPDDDAGLR